MRAKKLIFLIGMPGAGKTYWGERIAQHYQLQFTDLDIFIATHEKASIAALFATHGEHGFREKENNYLRKVINNSLHDTIVACGGGTPCFHNNMQLMKEAGTVIYLKSDIPELALHLAESPEIRPMLNRRKDIAGYLEKVLMDRKKFYEEADHIMHTKSISIINFEEIVSSCINGH